jgi:hypothetical protein
MIPKILHYCWLSGDPYSEKVTRCLSSWHIFLSDYDIYLWDTSRFDVNSTSWTREAFSARKYASVSDYVRFYALDKYGGIYIDSDVEIMKSFNDLLKYTSFFGYEYTGVPEAAIIGCEKNTPWIVECKKWYENRSYYNSKGKRIKTIAPLILQYGFEKSEGYKLLDKNKTVVVNNTAIFPYQYFSPKDGYTGKISMCAETYTIHHFESAWLKKNHKVALKRLLHILLIGLLGRNMCNKIMYRLRKHNTLERYQ